MSERWPSITLEERMAFTDRQWNGARQRWEYPLSPTLKRALEELLKLKEEQRLEVFGSIVGGMIPLAPIAKHSPRSMVLLLSICAG